VQKTLPLTLLATLAALALSALAALTTLLAPLSGLLLLLTRLLLAAALLAALATLTAALVLLSTLLATLILLARLLFVGVHIWRCSGSATRRRLGKHSCKSSPPWQSPPSPRRPRPKTLLYRQSDGVKTFDVNNPERPGEVRTSDPTKPVPVDPTKLGELTEDEAQRSPPVTPTPQRRRPRWPP
jgi:hypothetical protein